LPFPARPRHAHLVLTACTSSSPFPPHPCRSHLVLAVRTLSLPFAPRLGSLVELPPRPRRVRFRAAPRQCVAARATAASVVPRRRTHLVLAACAFVWPPQPCGLAAGRVMRSSLLPLPPLLLVHLFSSFSSISSRYTMNT
jgi:hypothetical protein